MNTNKNYRNWNSEPVARNGIYVPGSFKKTKKEDDFPPLVAIPSVKLRNESQGPSLATRIAAAIKNDEKMILAKKEEEVHPSFTESEFTVLPISHYARVKYLAQRKERALKEAEIAAEEHEYRWQISHEISRDKFDREYGIEPMTLPEETLEDKDQTEYKEENTDNHE